MRWLEPGSVDLTDPGQARGRCFIESHPVAVKAGALLVAATHREYNRGHWAVFFPTDPADPAEGGRVVDATARQFYPHTQAAPYEADLDTWLDDVAEWLHGSLDYALYVPGPSYGASMVQVFEDFWGREDMDVLA